MLSRTGVRLLSSIAPSATLKLPQFAILKQSIDRWEKTAIIDPTNELSYSQLIQAAHRLAHSGQMSNILPGDRVAFLCPRTSTYVIAQWAVWIKKAIAVPLCTLHPPKEIAHVVSDSGASTVLYSPEFKESIERVQPLVPHSPRWEQLNTSSLTANLKTTPITADWEPLDKSNGALIIYTSGTTGKPKGVLSTFSNVEAQVSSLHESWKWTCNDRILLVLPLHHVHGVINVVTCALAAGAVLEMAPEKMSPKEIWQRFVNSEQKDLTLFMAVPTIYSRLLEYYDSVSESEKTRLSNSCKQFRLMVSGSAALPVTVFDKWESVSGARLLERYGMTEIGMALGNPLDGERESGKVGYPFPGVQAKIVDESGAEVLENGKSGELFIRGPQVFKEYWGNSAATQKAFVDGWFATGDIATTTSPNNSYQILGRASVDIIKSGGYKLSALTIERELLSLPNVLDVAVLGVPHETWGEIVGAIIVYKEYKASNQEEVLQQLVGLLGDRLAKYEVPRSWVFVKEIPRNAMLKVNKKELVSMFMPR
ncbi:putative long chain fatty acid CoA ligase [Obelidium mucronatum]|nr:putative long chain fatty acid CoA ligase [Obelidium mucronatum]